MIVHHIYNHSLTMFTTVFHPFFTTFSMQKIDVSGHLGQLTSLGFDQCRRAGQQLKVRYPEARIRAFSTVAWRHGMVKLWG